MENSRRAAGRGRRSPSRIRRSETASGIPIDSMVLLPYTRVMKLMDPTRIALDDDVLTRLGDLEDSFSELNDHRDAQGVTIPREAMDRFDLVADAVHDSAAIEGLATSRRETELLLRSVADALPAVRIATGSQVQNLYQAVVRLGRLVGEEVRPSCATIIELHDLLMGQAVGPQFSPRGGWRREPVVIRRGTWLPPAHGDVPALMTDLETLLAQAWDTVPTVVTAAWAHHAVTQIHPFMDGNGRTARLVQDHVLWARRCAPAIIRVELLREYYQALEAADDGNLNPLVRMVAEGALGSALRLNSAYRAKRRRAAWADQLAQEAVQRVDAVEERRYVAWRSAMEDLRDAFAAGAEALGAALSGRGIDIRHRAYPTLDADAWRSIPRAGRAAPHWFFTVSFVGLGRNDLYVFSFGRHFRFDDDPPDERTGIVDLKLSVKRGTVRTDLHRELTEPVPHLRAIWVVEGRLRARLVAPSLDAWERLDEADPDELARSFYTEVLRSHFAV